MQKYRTYYQIKLSFTFLLVHPLLHCNTVFTLGGQPLHGFLPSNHLYIPMSSILVSYLLIFTYLNIARYLPIQYIILNTPCNYSMFYDTGKYQDVSDLSDSHSHSAVSKEEKWLKVGRCRQGW